MIFLIIIGLIISILGLIGCILPVLPGPPLSFIALIVLSIAKAWEPFSPEFLLGMAILAIVVTVLDFVVPLFGAKKYGASKIGMWGSVAGMVIGLIFFPPWGMLIGTFLGALGGEILAGKRNEKALKAGFGVFVGTIFGIGFKIAASGIMLFYYIKEMF